MLLALSVISPQGASLGSTAFKVFDARGGSHLSSWIGTTKLVRVRNFDPRKGIAVQGLTTDDIVETGGRRFLDEQLFKILVRQPERHVHPRPVLLARGSSIEPRPINLGVQLRGLAFVRRGDGCAQANCGAYARNLQKKHGVHLFN